MITPETVSAYGSIGAFIGMMVVGVMNKLDARKADRARDKAAVVAEDTHKLVNSQMGVQLRVNMQQAQRLAALTGKPECLVIAQEAERMYNEHQAKQKTVDDSRTEK